MGDASGHRKSVTVITHRTLLSAGLATSVTTVRGQEGNTRGHALGGGSAARIVG
jgi:hypothetical protein